MIEGKKRIDPYQDYMRRLLKGKGYNKYDFDPKAAWECISAGEYDGAIECTPREKGQEECNYAFS